ncbi:MAG: DMT family transporter [Lachnospiraceae bacterium]|nr:DMT family transporter [Lachnospiraceae bacterium]
MKNGQRNLLQKRGVVIACAVLCTLLWGSAFPCVKTGYNFFDIKPENMGSQMLFAGIRFLLAGCLTIAASFIWERDKKAERKKSGLSIRGILLLGFVQTFLQYVFYYIGMAHVSGVKGAIMNGTSAFLCVITATYFYKEESLGSKRLFGCFLGMAGVVIVNLGKGGIGGNFSLLGEGFMLISAVCVALGALISKEVSRSMNPLTLCGWQLLAGGVMLVLTGTLTGGQCNWNKAGVSGLMLLFYMAFLSAAAFGLWTALLKYNQMGQITVFNFLIPVFGTILSAIILRENIWNLYVVCSLPLVCVGIYLVNKTD